MNDGDISNPQTWGSKLTSVNIGIELHDLCKKNQISLRDALEFGIKFKLADKDGFDYPQSNLLEKLHRTVKHRNALMLEVEALRQQVAGTENIEDLEDQTEKDLNQVFGEVKKDENKN